MLTFSLLWYTVYMLYNALCMANSYFVFPLIFLDHIDIVHWFECFLPLLSHCLMCWFYCRSSQCVENTYNNETWIKFQQNQKSSRPLKDKIQVFLYVQTKKLRIRIAQMVQVLTRNYFLHTHKNVSISKLL